MFFQGGPSYGSNETEEVVLNIKIAVKNLSRGDEIWYKSLKANPSDKLLFRIKVESQGKEKAENVMVRVLLAPKIIYQGDLKIDNKIVFRNISKNALNIGNLSPGTTKTITFKAKVAPSKSFVSTKTNLINTALTYNSKTSDTAICKVIVQKEITDISSATEVKTGITDRIVNSILFPLTIALLTVWIFRSKLIGLDKWMEERKQEITEYRAKKKLKKEIERIRRKGVF